MFHVEQLTYATFPPKGGLSFRLKGGSHKESWKIMYAQRQVSPKLLVV